MGGKRGRGKRGGEGVGEEGGGGGAKGVVCGDTRIVDCCEKYCFYVPNTTIKDKGLAVVVVVILWIVL